MNVIVHDVTSKRGLSGIWYMASASIGRREYLVRAVRLGDVVSVFSCKTLNSGKEANTGGHPRKLIEKAMVGAVGATMTADEFLEQSPITSEDL